MTRKRLLRFALAFLVIYALGTAIAWWRWGWRGVESLTTDASTVLIEPILDWSGHDHRYGLVGGESYALHLSPPAGTTGELLFLGAKHTRDPASPQVEELRRRWGEFRPTVALVESRLGLFFGGADAGVRQFGEPGAAYALARAAGVPIYSLEPSHQDEVRVLTQRFAPEHVLMFYAMRAFGSELKAGRVTDPDPHFMALLRKRADAPQLQGLFASAADVDRYWKEHYPALPDWRTAPEWPEGSPQHDMFFVSNLVRDEHAARVIVELVRRGERVFAVSGLSHTIKQEPAIRALLPGFTDGPFASPRPWEAPQPPPN